MDGLTRDLENSNGRKIFYDYLKTEFDNADKLLEKFDKLTEFYFDINSIVNISAMRNVDDVYVKHYLDSIYPHIYFSGDCCDIGCGGGFPTIPLSIVNKNKITGVDSVGKKLMLIKKCVSKLGLTNLNSAYSRSEDLAKLRHTYQTVCARALADVDKSISLCAPLVADGGKLILYRTQNDLPAKQQTLEKYGVTLEMCEDYVLPNTDIKRRLMIYKK